MSARRVSIRYQRPKAGRDVIVNVTEHTAEYAPPDEKSLTGQRIDWIELTAEDVRSRLALCKRLGDLSRGESSLDTWCRGEEFRKVLGILDIDLPLPEDPVPLDCSSNT